MWSDCVKRRAFKLPLFLLAGAIINVAVAWGCALRADVSERNADVMSVSGKPALPSDSSLFFAADSAFLKDYCRFRVQTRGVGIREVRVSHWSYNLAQEDTGDVLAQRACGWPALSLQGCCHEMNQMEWAIRLPHQWKAWLRLVTVVPVSGGLTVVYNPRTWLGNRAAPEILPLWPLWPGFAINTIFYAAIVWMLFAVPGAVRRRIGGVRIKRGQCASCGYSLRESVSEKCPECGAAAPLI
jgi:hypothetical protein